MKEIMTVLGPIGPNELGFTSMHEHIIHDVSAARRRYESTLTRDLPVAADDPVSLENIGLLKRNFTLTFDALRMDDEELMTAEVADFKDSGGHAMVEMSVPTARLNLPAIKQVSQKTGVHVIATTGLFGGTRGEEDAWPEQYRESTVEGYAGYMLAEIEQGIEDTGIKAGHIKIGIGDLSKQQERLLRAAARVATETGLSVTVHPGIFSIIGADGRRIIKILAGEGMNLERLILAHTQQFFIEHDLKTLIRNPDSWHLRLDYAKELVDRGANISIDCFGSPDDSESIGWIQGTDWQRLAGLIALIEAGYSPQIVLGTDTWIKPGLRRCGGEGYCRLTKFVVPLLRDLGVSDYDIRQMTVENPARLLAR